MKSFLENLTRFNLWANQRIVQWLTPLEDEKLCQPALSSFSSIDYTLQHILRAERFWYAFIRQDDLKHFSWAVREGEVRLVMQDLLLQSEALLEYTLRVSDADLHQTLHPDTPWAKNNLPRYEYFVHVVNHGSFHRGQIVTIARQIGLTDGIPNTDYNIYNTLARS